MSDWYTLDADNRPVLAEDFMQGARWKHENEDRCRVARTQIGDVDVSTVFLGLDHSWNGGPPLLFETMIFGGEHDKYQERCSTWAQAEAMHETACALVRGNRQ